MEEIWNCVGDSDETQLETEDSDSGEDFMAISIQTLNGTDYRGIQNYQTSRSFARQGGIHAY